MSERIWIFDQPVVLEAIKIHATAVNEGFLVTLIASLDDDSIIWAATAERAQASLDDVTPMITELTERFKQWKIEVRS